MNASAEPSVSRPPSSWGRWLMVVAVVGLVCVPLTIVLIPREMAQWYRAAGQEEWLSGQVTKALRYADQSLEYDDQSPNLR